MLRLVNSAKVAVSVCNFRCSGRVRNRHSPPPATGLSQIPDKLHLLVVWTEQRPYNLQAVAKRDIYFVGPAKPPAGVAAQRWRADRNRAHSFYRASGIGANFGSRLPVQLHSISI